MECGEVGVQWSDGEVGVQWSQRKLGVQWSEGELGSQWSEGEVGVQWSEEELGVQWNERRVGVWVYLRFPGGLRRFRKWTRQVVESLEDAGGVGRRRTGSKTHKALVRVLKG